MCSICEYQLFYCKYILVENLSYLQPRSLIIYISPDYPPRLITANNAFIVSNHYI